MTIDVSQLKVGDQISIEFKPRSEQEIMSTWKGDLTQPLVSISCTVYNQIDYVKRCIEGFLNQKTSFPIEIIIHDDASTDGTADILRSYKSRYPRLITLTLQTENQFSEGKNINHVNFSIAKGKFIALCHGDDFWTDRYKLEKQVAAMLQNQANISGHPAHEINIKDKYLGRITGFQVKTLTLFNPNVLINQQGNMLPFGSIMITEEAKYDLLKYMPPVMFHSGIQLLGALRGGILVLPDIMVAYRTLVPGSTTEIMLGNFEKKVATTLKRIGSIKALKKLYGKEYSFSLNRFLASQINITFRDKGNKNKRNMVKEIMSEEVLMDKIILIYYFNFFKIKDILSRNKRLIHKTFSSLIK